jgi:hypothetical protein
MSWPTCLPPGLHDTDGPHRGPANSDANRTIDTLLKSRWVSQVHGGDRGVVFMTGTTVSQQRHP